MCDEREAVLRLLRADGIGHGRVRMLRLALGGAAGALQASPSEFAAAIGVAESEGARMLCEARCAEVAGSVAAELAFLSRAGARAVVEGVDDYPALLEVMPDPPPILFLRGELAGEPEAAVAIVGSRRASAYGRLQAGRIAAELAERGVTVVSGGARGIDAEAHRGALRAGGRTIAVLATGLANPYPSEHVPLFDAIVEAGGALVTEQCAEVTARPDLFPRRNRIIAGLALVTVVVEAAARSGALLTARLAVDDLSRSAGCVPGQIDSVTSEGCHRAIREGWAQLVTGAADICELVEEMRSTACGARERRGAAVGRAGAVFRRHGPAPRSGSCPQSRSESPDPPDIGQDAALVLRAVRSAGRAGLDELERALEWTVPRIALATLELERAGLAVRDPEGAYRSTSA